MYLISPADFAGADDNLAKALSALSHTFYTFLDNLCQNSCISNLCTLYLIPFFQTLCPFFLHPSVDSQGYVSYSFPSVCSVFSFDSLLLAG